MPNIAVIGSGLIGKNIAMIFASSPDNRVCLYDVDQSQLDSAIEDCRSRLTMYQKDGMLRGSDSPEQQLARISTSSNLAECVKSADYIQECIPEVLEMKQKVFKQLDELAPPDCVKCSSSSCIMPSLFTESLKSRNNCLVAHPVNPPYFLPLIELVPAPWTDKSAVAKAKSILEAVDEVPVVLQKEIDGFIANRLQYPIINEAWSLVKNGIVSAGDVDKVMSFGLGPRYAFYGALETMHLNANGIQNYCDSYGKGMERVTKDLFTLSEYDQPTLETIAKEMNQKVPLYKLEDERKAREKKIAKCMQLKKEL